MEKRPLSPEDQALVKAAMDAVKKPVRQPEGGSAPALVGAAMRLDNGKIVTAVNLMADVGSLSVCAEPIAIAEANKFPEQKIQASVAVYLRPGQEPRVIPPCGKCREIITDYAPGAEVVMRDPGSEALFKVKAADLLPWKYASFWQGSELV